MAEKDGGPVGVDSSGVKDLSEDMEVPVVNGASFRRSLVPAEGMNPRQESVASFLDMACRVASRERLDIDSIPHAIHAQNPPEEVHRLLDRWSSYQGLVYFHLLLDRLAGAGFL